MQGWAARAAMAGALLSLTPTLASCASEPVAAGLGSSRAALEAVRSLGVEAVPYTQVRCAGLQVDWFADSKAYDAAWLADCSAVPPDNRAGMESISIVKGPDWLIRGNGDGDINAWPRSVTPAEAAAKLGGQPMTAADYCRSLRAW
jgi:hypothetical protein